MPGREQGRTIVTMTKDHDLAQLRYGSTTKFLSYLSAAWCGISLAIGAIMTAALGDGLREELLESSPKFLLLRV
jgi:hypothetical protein